MTANDERVRSSRVRNAPSISILLRPKIGPATVHSVTVDPDTVNAAVAPGRRSNR
jgi:hypothetical protein